MPLSKTDAPDPSVTEFPPNASVPEETVSAFVTLTLAVSVTPELLLTLKLPMPLAAVGRALPVIWAAVPL